MYKICNNYLNFYKYFIQLASAKKIDSQSTLVVVKELSKQKIKLN